MNPLDIFAVAQTALECVCSQMTALAGEDGVPEGYGCPCYAFVSAGEPPIDCCTVECDSEEVPGMLTVHISDVFPSDAFPVATQDFEPCKAATWVATLVVTSARCAPSTDEQGHPAAVDALTDNAELMAIDQYAILTALGCCLVADAPGNKRKRRVQIQGSRPLVSEGGCASVEVRALVEIGVVCNCPPESS